jgi:hypothetical protein
MEVGKVILNAVNKKSTMTLSVKPFGCMPSSGVSDGVQSLIVEKFPGTIFCAVETSGDGAVNFQSRVQMYLSKAKQSARDEFEKALEQHGLSAQAVRDYLKRHPSTSSALFVAPHRARTRVADLVHATAQGQVPTRTRFSNWLDERRQNLANTVTGLSAQLRRGHESNNAQLKTDSSSSTLGVFAGATAAPAKKPAGARIAA